MFAGSIKHLDYQTLSTKVCHIIKDNNVLFNKQLIAWKLENKDIISYSLTTKGLFRIYVLDLENGVIIINTIINYY